MPDFDAIEHEFIQAAGPLPICPSPDVLLACNQGVLPSALEQAVQKHIQDCSVCKMLLNDLASLSTFQAQPVLTTKQNRTIRARIPGLASRPGWAGFVAVAAAAVLAAILLNHRPHHAAATSAAQAPSMPVSAPLAKLDPPEGILSGAEMRTALPTGRPTPAELAPAFIAYSQNKYREAATDFSVLSERYPESDIVFLYMGVSQLFLDEDETALATLGRAVALAQPARADAANWYHAVAALRLQDTDSKHLFDQQCTRRGSPYARQACVMAKLIEANPPAQL